MKKLIIAVCLVLVSTFSHAQEWEKVRMVNIIEYKNGRWVDGNSHYPDNYFIKLNGSEVIVKANEINKYMTYGSSNEVKYDTHVAYSWNAIDDSGDNCTFIMKKFFADGTTIYMITYRSVGVEFYLK
jgi:hypothetical protein